MKTMIWVACATMMLCYACRTAQVTKPPYVHAGKLLGQHPVQALLDTPYANWYQSGYRAYVVPDSAAGILTEQLKQKQFLIFYGTWCGDSRREIPRLVHLLDQCGVSAQQIRLVAVDDEDSVYKQSPGKEEIGLNIHRVPTLIIYDQQKEMGRIVETPVESWEKDMLRILSRQTYVPNYRAVPVLDLYLKQLPVDSLTGSLPAMAAVMKPLIKKAGELNTYGYVLMGQRKLVEALFVFQLNAALFPELANVFDSLGECYEKLNNPSAALAQYQRAVLLDPKQSHAPERIRALQSLN